MTDYDTPWKEALERYFREFMALLFPLAHAEIDWAQGYEFLDKELQQVVRDAQLGKRLADKLVRVRDRNGEEDWLLIHLEVQGQREADFARRMYTYHYRIYDRYQRPVVSLAVLGDTSVDWRPEHFGYRRWGCELSLRFPVVKLLDYQPRWEELDCSPNPFAVIIQAHLKAQHSRGAERYNTKLALVKSLYRRGLVRADILELFRCIDWLLQLPPALEDQLWSDLKAYEEVEKMPYVTSVERIGIRKGLQQGLQHQRHALLRQVGKRFGAEVAEQSAPLLERIDDFQPLEDLFEQLLDSADGEAWLQALRQTADR